MTARRKSVRLASPAYHSQVSGSGGWPVRSQRAWSGGSWGPGQDPSYFLVMTLSPASLGPRAGASGLITMTTGTLGEEGGGGRGVGAQDSAPPLRTTPPGMTFTSR